MSFSCNGVKGMPRSAQTDASRPCLVINGDDLGLQHCFNEGIRIAHQKGLLTSASLRANGMALRDALETVLPSCPRLGVGAHLCLNEGKTVSPPGSLPRLADRQGWFRRTHAAGFLYMLLFASRALRHEVEREIRAQIEYLLARAPLDHVNGHQHIHMVPWIFETTLRLAEEYRLPWIRWANEPVDWVSLVKHRPRVIVLVHALNMRRLARKNGKLLSHSPVRHNHSFWGLLHTGTQSMSLVERSLGQAKQYPVSELLLHPGTPNHPLDHIYVCGVVEQYCRDPERQRELDTLCSAELRDTIQALGFRLTNYRELVQQVCAA
jgi:chitin disaccharide deacetylase